MLCCTFTGHREILHKGVKESVERELHALMERDSEFRFYVGREGEFDLLSAQLVRQLKGQRPEKQIHLILAEPYMKQSINTDGKWLSDRYDDIIIPEGLLGIHYKAAIKRRNQWMIDHSQILIAYVRKDHGGAFTSLTYAQRRGLNVIRI